MKHLPFVVVLLGMTAAMITFRGLFWHPADASRRPDLAVKVERASIDERQRPEGAALDFVPAEGGEPKDGTGSEKLMARLAADCAQQLHERAKKRTDNARLLQQAAAHYRACLSHEPTVSDAGDLFREARKNLEQIEATLARAARPAVPAPKPAPKPGVKPPAPVVKKEEKPAPPAAQPGPAPAPVAQPKEDEPIMVAPDGTIIRRLPPEGR